MKRIFVLAALLLAPALAAATPVTWSQGGVKAVCATGSGDAPTLATQGIPLANVPRVAIQVCADSGQTITGGSGIVLYFYDATSALWGRFNTSVYTIATGARCAWVQGDSPGFGIPILAPRGRLAAVPSGITVSSGNVTVWLFAVNAAGSPL